MKKAVKVAVVLVVALSLFFFLAPVVNSHLDVCPYLPLIRATVSPSYYLFGIGEVYYGGQFQFITACNQYHS